MVIFKPTEVRKIIKTINDGNVVALPTDTVYGLTCKFDQPAAIKKIYQIKNRSAKKPLQILVANWNQAKKIGLIDDQLINYLTEKFQLGKVTVIVKPTKILKENQYWKQWDTIAVRVTVSDLVQKIIDDVGPLAASSCNLSGQDPINDSNKINLDNLDYIVSGKIVNPKPSTIYDSLIKQIIRN